MSTASEREPVDGRRPVHIEDYLDADGAISMPPGVNLISFLDRSIAEVGDFVAYRYLDYTRSVEGEAIDLTWTRLGIRLRAISARLQQVTTRGERVAILA